MTQTVVLKRSSVASKIPLSTDLAYGELALNYQDGKLYFKKADGTTISYFLSNSSSTFIGTTSVALTRASGAQTLTGVNIDGSAGSLTNALTIGTGLTGTSYNGSSAVTISITNPVPTQTGNSGKYLTTDGTTLSWATVAASGGSGTVTSIVAGTGLSGGTITTTGTIALANTAVTAGSYTSANITVDAQGRVTSAANGSGVGAAASGTYARTSFTATAGQTAFTVTYTVGYIQIFVNGVLLSASDYTASSGTSFTLGVAASVGDIVEAAVYSSGAFTRTSFTATSGQTAFTSAYTVGQLQVYVNGIFLNNSDYTATNGTTFSLSIAANTGDIVEAINVTSFSAGVTTGKSIAMAMIFGY